MPSLVKGSGLPRRQETGAARQRGGQEHSGGPGSGAWASTSPPGPGFSVWSGDGALEEHLADPCCTGAVTWSLLPLGFLDTESQSVAGGGWGGGGSEGRLASCTEVTPPPERGYQVRGGLCALMCVRQASELPGLGCGPEALGASLSPHGRCGSLSRGACLRTERACCAQHAAWEARSQPQPAAPWT